MRKHSHYFFPIPKGLTEADIYRLIEIVGITCPAAQHVFKKAAAAGRRGHKDLRKDWEDIRDTAIRKLEMLDEDEQAATPNATPDTGIGMMNFLHKNVVLDGHEIDTDFDSEKTRMPQVGTNGNEGEHYAEVGDGWVAHYGGPQPVPDGTVVQCRMLDGARDEKPAGHLRWDWKGWPGDIMSYKISNTVEADHEWVVNTGEVPNLAPGTQVECVRRDGVKVFDIVDKVRWEMFCTASDIARYRIVEDR